MIDVLPVIRVAIKLWRLVISKEDKREVARFEKIYTPLQVLFLTRHITTVSSYGAPYLRQRLRNAGDYLAEGKVLRGLKAIFDKQPWGPNAEVEFGGPFPLSQILHIVEENERYCDQTLLNLIAQADRARYEESTHDYGMTSAELSLFDHIIEQHRALSKKFVGT